MSDEDKTREELLSELDLLRLKYKSLEDLQKDYKRTVEELTKSRDELIQSEKLSFAGRMAASVAHEIRNPLSIISMAVQQLHNEFPENDKRKDYTQAIIKNINRVNNLINEFVNAARPPRLKMQWGSINEILEDILKLIQPKCIKCKAELIKDLSPWIPKIRVDEEHITQAFINILNNACDALPKKGGKIWVTTNRDNEYCVITIRNEGRPIPQKDIIRIFDPFFSTKKTGTGLGLSIAYGIIGSHRGTISIESNKEIGTVFKIKLPH